LFVGALSLAALASSSAHASKLLVSGDANSEADLAGYKLYCDVDTGAPYTGDFAKEGPSPIDVPLGTLADKTHPSLTLTVPTCSTVFVAATAYNTSAV